MELSAADQLELLQLYARYAHRVDDLDEAGWLGVWTDEPLLTVDGQRHEGTSGLHGFYRTLVDAFGGALRHYTSTVAVEADGDGAVGTAYAQVLHTTSGQLIITGTYRDELARTPAGWRFAARQFRSDQAASRPG